ncbi:MAG: hypothetical protein R3B90_11975 [Planctomycetaceae bacterium]
MPQPSLPVNRTLVGVLAVVLTLAGVAVGLYDSLDNMWCGGLLRTGVLLAALWIALPTRHRPAAWANISPWTAVGAVILLVIFVRQPRAFIIVVAILVAGAIFVRPRRR